MLTFIILMIKKNVVEKCYRIYNLSSTDLVNTHTHTKNSHLHLCMDIYEEKERKY